MEACVETVSQNLSPMTFHSDGACRLPAQPAPSAAILFRPPPSQHRPCGCGRVLCVRRAGAEPEAARQAGCWWGAAWWLRQAYEAKAAGREDGDDLFARPCGFARRQLSCPANIEHYADYAERVRRILETYTPAVETAALDDFLSGLCRDGAADPDYRGRCCGCRWTCFSRRD